MNVVNGFPCRPDHAPELRDRDTLARYAAKHDSEWIANYLGVTVETVRRWLHRHGLRAQRRKHGTHNAS